MVNPHRGSSLEDFLREEGILEEATTAAIKRVLAYQLKEEMKRQQLTKVEMARRMDTSRAQLDRVLNPEDGNVTLNTIQRAAAVVGKKVRLELG